MSHCRPHHRPFVWREVDWDNILSVIVFVALCVFGVVASLDNRAESTARDKCILTMDKSLNYCNA